MEVAIDMLSSQTCHSRPCLEEAHNLLCTSSHSPSAVHHRPPAPCGRAAKINGGCGASRIGRLPRRGRERNGHGGHGGYRLGRDASELDRIWIEMGRSDEHGIAGEKLACSLSG